ncbi:Rad17 cell cycle checkpoint protein-domain-containing protein [Massariosphaeria phaeospora]|uniref:Rad17 cell cycle checkpoint protein-domain-containing protein n=1 Tax=Massariosphaeria phaeospora TaxID=100035 RepID=A0A7C8I4P1_9PLEO|nr:Rad17 cell cycle checkpoint protein-domain-containing protein [Massariosphaeria phaeospora]
MAKPRAARKKPVVLSSDSDDDEQHSPPPKRSKRAPPALTSAPNNGAAGDSKASRFRTRRAASPKPKPLPTLSSQKSPGKSPAKPKSVYKPITTFFKHVPRPQTAQPTPSPEKPASGTPLLDIDDILDSSEDDEYRTRRPTALAVRRKGKEPLAGDADGSAKGSQRFLRATTGARSTPPPSQTLPLDKPDGRPWNEQFGPVSLDELAVHKKKVSDVRSWLLDVFNGKERKRLLLLKGPAGSGKTATMRLLSQDLGLDMHEWKNPTRSTSSTDGFASVTAQFHDFVGRTGTFGSLTFDVPAQSSQLQAPPSTRSSRHKQLILVEEFPNTFARASSAVQSFRTAVLTYLAANTPSATAFFSANASAEQQVTPIVMIISETLLSTNTAAADSFTAHRLLGAEILAHPGVSVIEFNPIAPTFMSKALELIVLKEARKSGRKKTVGPQVIMQLTELGDIRSAISSLEFLCVRGEEDEGWGGKVNFTKKKGPKDTPLTKMEQESLELVTQRESTLGIFHAVGRVVYNKRLLEDPHGVPVPQPPHCFPERRRPKISEVRVDSLIDEIGTDTSTFIAALHENYVLSCEGGDIEETMDAIGGCIDSLSDADLLSPDRFGYSDFARRSFQGTSTDTLRQDEMSFETSVRGILYNLPHPVKRIAPPPGIMGAKAKGPGASKGSAFVMYYPASLRLWRQQEELGGLLEMWIARAQRGELLSPGIDISKAGIPSTGGVDTWRKTAVFSKTTNPPSTQSTGTTAEDAPPPVLVGSGGSARYEMLLERLPYFPTILRKPSMRSPATAAAIRDIQKLTSFSGKAIPGSPEDDLEGDNQEPGELEQWSTDKPESGTPKKRRKNRIEDKDREVESALAGAVDTGGGHLVLSDDDIED